MSQPTENSGGAAAPEAAAGLAAAPSGGPRPEGLAARAERDGEPFEPARWSAAHLHYHEDQDLLLDRLLVPLAGELLARNAIDRFYFVRFPLGGPHLRLRLRRVAETGADELLRLVGERAGDFFAAQPSRRSIPPEEIERQNRALLAFDRSEDDDAVYPDNSWRPAPFRPEVERYGGSALLPLSLDLFTVSSVAALDTLAEVRGASRSRHYSASFALLAALAQGLAADAGELAGLLAGPSPGSHGPLQVIEKAEKVFADQREALCRVFAAPSDGLPATLAGSARRLRRRLDDLAPQARRHVLASHLHMTANRLGLRTAEEVYLGRLLSLAAQEAGEPAPASEPEGDPVRAALERFTARRRESPDRR